MVNVGRIGPHSAIPTLTIYVMGNVGIAVRAVIRPTLTMLRRSRPHPSPVQACRYGAGPEPTPPAPARATP